MWATVFALGIFVSFLMHQTGAISRLWAATWFGMTALALAGVRIAVYAVLGAARDRGMDKKRVLLVGFGALGHDMWRRVEKYREAGYQISGIYAEPHEILPPQVRRLHDLDNLTDFVRENKVREIWIVLPMEAGQELREVLYHLRNDLVDIRWIPDVMSIQLLGHRIGEFLGLPATGLPVEIRVMDFYRRGGNFLAEDWIFIDFPHLFLHLGIDLFARMAERRDQRINATSAGSSA